MGLSEFEIGKIAEIVAGRTGSSLDAKSLRQVIDKVVDAMKAGNPEITGATCETPSSLSRSGSERSEKPDIPPRVLPPDQALVADKGGLYEQIEKTDGNRIIVAAFGKDRPGIAAALTAVLAENSCSVEDISQTLMQDFFSMIMIANIAGCPVDFSALRDKVVATEAQFGMKVYVMHEDIFRYMHRI